MRIRPAEEKDLEAITAIYNQGVEERWNAQMNPVSMKERAKWMKKEHPADKFPIFVAESDGSVIGWASINQYHSNKKGFRSTGEVSYYVHKDVRRRGVGEALLRYLLECAPSYGFHHVIAVLLSHNLASVGMLEKCGFKHWGTMPDVVDMSGYICSHLYYGIEVPLKRQSVSYSEQNALKLAHAYWKEHIRPGDVCVDATAGRGKDTALLCELAGPAGQIYAFDVQPEAVKSTQALLEREGYADQAQVILDSHENMTQYVGSAKCVIFNFGYLPGGNHAVFTKKESSIAAIEAALSIITEDGFVSLCIYYGGDSGFEEKDALMEYLRGVDSKRYTVMVQDFFNRPNCPPIFVLIEKNKG